MSLRFKARLGLALAVVAAGVLALPPATGAAPPTILQDFVVPNAGPGVYGGHGGQAFVFSRGSAGPPARPPRLYVFANIANPADYPEYESTTLDLPEGTDAIDLYRDHDGYVNLMTRDGGVIVIDPFGPGRKPAIVGSTSIPDGSHRPIGIAQGFNVNIAAYFGLDTEQGFFRFGNLFDGEVSFPDMPELSKPNGIDLDADARRTYDVLSRPRAAASRAIPSVFVVVDADNNLLWLVSDRKRPAIVRTLPGPPAATGAWPPRDVAVSPLNYNRKFSSGTGRHPVIVPVPGVGNVFVLRDGTWRPLSSTPFGRPQGVAAACNAVLVTDYHFSRVFFFKFKQPKGTVCEDLVNVALGGKRISRPKVLIKPYGNFTATVSLTFKGKGRTKARRTRLKAGRIKTVGLKFSRRASRRIAAALRRHRSLKGTLTLRLKNKAGEKFTVKRRIRIKRG